MLIYSHLSYLLSHIGWTSDHWDDGKHCLLLGPTRLKPSLHWNKHVWLVVYPVHDMFPCVIDDNDTQGFAVNVVNIIIKE